MCAVRLASVSPLVKGEDGSPASRKGACRSAKRSPRPRRGGAPLGGGDRARVANAGSRTATMLALIRMTTSSSAEACETPRGAEQDLSLRLADLQGHESPGATYRSGTVHCEVLGAFSQQPFFRVGYPPMAAEPWGFSVRGVNRCRRVVSSA